MAADDAAVVVTLRANLKEYEAALKSAVRSTETAARAAEKAVSGIGKGGGASKVIEGNFKKSSQAIANDAKILQFQLNDIFSGLASGQGIRAVQVQLGQIAQQMTGQSLRQGASSLASAFGQMITPLNIAVVAFGVLLPLAVSYFSSSKEKAKEAAEALKKQSDELEDLAKKYGALFPALVRIADAHRKAADEAQRQLGFEIAIADAYETSANAIEKLRPQMTLFLASLSSMGQTENAAKLQKAFNNLSTAIDQHKAKAEDVKAVMDAWNEILAKQKGLVSDLTVSLGTGLADAFAKVGTDAQKASDIVKGFANVPGPGGGDWLTSPQRLNFSLLGGTPLEAALEKAADAIDGFTERVIQAESGGDPNAKNPLSSATGAGQFIDSTWLEVFKRNFATEAAGMSDAAILAMRTDIEANRRMIRAYATENAKLLIDAGQEVNEAALQLAHFLGAGGAIAVLKARPGTPVSQILSANQINANQSILGGGATREDVLGYAARRAGAPTTVKLTDQAKALKNLADWNVETERRIELEKQVAQINAKVGQTEAARQAQIEGLRLAEEQLYALKKAGVEISPEVEASIRATAQALADATAASEQALAASKALTDEQKKAAEEMRQVTEQLLSSALTTFTHDLMAGKDAGEAFNDMLRGLVSQIADLAIKMLIIKPLMGSLFGTGTGTATGIMGFAAGGTVGLSGQSDGRKFSPALWSGAPRFASGGMVGLRPGEMPIIAHRGEIIIPNARRLAGNAAGAASGRQRVDVMVSASPSPLLDLKIKTSAAQAEQRAVARGPAVARDNSRRFSVP
jgi:hypothetical protein